MNTLSQRLHSSSSSFLQRTRWMLFPSARYSSYRSYNNSSNSNSATTCCTLRLLQRNNILHHNHQSTKNRIGYSQRRWSSNSSNGGGNKSTKKKEVPFLERFLAPKPMPPRNTPKWYAEMALLCTVFGITGSSTMFLVRPAVSNVLGLEGNMKEGELCIC